MAARKTTLRAVRRIVLKTISTLLVAALVIVRSVTNLEMNLKAPRTVTMQRRINKITLGHLI